jgi:uncharacterized protein (DUF2141 family)
VRFLLATLLLLTADPAPRIDVEVTGVRSDRGALLCALYRSEDGFPAEPHKAAAQASARAATGTVHCTFPASPAGRLAVAVIHDEDGDGRLGRNFLGIPREGVGVSRDAQGKRGPPRFEDAAITYGGGPHALRIHLRY